MAMRSTEGATSGVTGNSTGGENGWAKGAEMSVSTGATTGGDIVASIGAATGVVMEGGKQIWEVADLSLLKITEFVPPAPFTFQEVVLVTPSIMPIEENDMLLKTRQPLIDCVVIQMKPCSLSTKTYELPIFITGTKTIQGFG